METVKTGQLGLIGFTEVLNPVFNAKEIKNSSGQVIGTAIGLKSKKELAEQFDLKGKDNRSKLDALVLQNRDEAFNKIKSGVAGLNGDWTMHRLADRTSKAGERQITIVMREVKRKTGPSDEAIAASLGWTVEQVREARDRQTKALENQTLEADTTVTKE